MTDAIYDFLQRDRFAKHVGIELLEVSEGRAKARLELSERHLNGADVTHGAAIFSLADFVFAAASNSHGTLALAINAHVSFMKAVRTGILLAEAREISRNPKLASYTVSVTDEAHDTVAVFQGMVYRKKDPVA